MTATVTPRRWDWVDWTLVVAALLIALGYLLLGVGRVMDDWYALNNAHFNGWWRAAGTDQMSARPGAAVTYAVVFGLLGGWVTPTVLMMALANAGSALLLRRLVTMVAPGAIAAAAAACWLVLPTTTSLEAWASAANISFALVASLGALWLAASREGTVLVCAGAGALALTSVLSYEATLVLLVPAALALLAAGRGSRRSRAAVIIGASAAFVWVVSHWHPNKQVTSTWGDVGQVIPANFTWGVASGRAGQLVGSVVLLVSAVVFAGMAGRGHKSARGSLLVGWGLLGLGVLPFLKYTYAPLGAGDRVNVVSSLGGAIVIATVIWVLAGSNGRVLAAVTVATLLLALPGRVVMMRSWALGGEDSERILRAVEAEASRTSAVVLGPVRVDRNGVTAMQHSDIFEDAVQLTLDSKEVSAEIAPSPEAFGRSHAIHIDVRRLLADPDAPGSR